MEGITRVICLLLLLGFAASRTSSPDEAALKQILQHMDNTTDPCVNFQKYSSGKFLDLHKEDGINSLYGLVKQKFNDRMRKMFDGLKYRVFKDSASVEEKVWQFYDACLTSPRYTQTWKHYIQLVPPAQGLTWPQFTPRSSQWPKQNFKWLETLARLRRFGLDTLLIAMDVEPRTDGSRKFKVVLGKQQIDTVEGEMETRNLLITLGVSRKRVANLARDITALEGEIKELGEVAGFPRILSIEEFEKRTKLSLGKFLGTVFGSSFDASFVVETYDMKYLEGLQDLLEKYESETVASYLMVSFVRYLSSLDGSQAEGDPAKCAAAVALHMQPASELLYKDFYLQQGKFQRNIDEVQRLFQLISSFVRVLYGDRSDLQPDEVQHITEKLSKMTVNVGRLPDIQNQRSFVTDFYSNLNLESTEPDLAEMHLKILEHRNRKVLEQLDRPVPRGKGFYLLSNDRYASAEPELQVCDNTIVLPLDILQKPFFTPHMHDVFKASLLGFILARQILSNFLPQNMAYNGEGVKGSIMEDIGLFQGYIDAMGCPRGKDSPVSDERVLDVMAMRIVYRIFYGKDSKFNQEEPSFTNLPGRQLFLLNLGQAFVGDARHLMEGRFTDAGQLRLNQALKNLPSFRRVFNCGFLSALGPQVRCV